MTDAERQKMVQEEMERQQKEKLEEYYSGLANTFLGKVTTIYSLLCLIFISEAKRNR